MTTHGEDAPLGQAGRENQATSLTMIDLTQGGQLTLPVPEFRTSSEITEQGSVTVHAIPGGTATSANANEKMKRADTPAASASSANQEMRWVKVPSAPNLDDSVKELWHYTDAGGIVGIISSHALRARPLFSTNDSAEYFYGRAILEELIQEIDVSSFIHPVQKEFIHAIIRLSDETSASAGLFALCASESADSLVQWRAYGGSSPHAVLIDPGHALAVVSPTRVEHRIDSVEHAWRRVLYSREDQRKLLLEVLGFIAHAAPLIPLGEDQKRDDEALRSIAMVLVKAISYCKEPRFAVESEVRMVIQVPGRDSLRFKPGPMGVAPFVEVTAATEDGGRTVEVARYLPVMRVSVGPFSKRVESAAAVRLLLDGANYDAVEVNVSASSQR